MRLDWLEDVVALLDSGSMDAAAKSRLLTQPAFSRRIKALEQLLGFDLVQRERKPSRPVNLLVDKEAVIRDLAARTRALLAELRRESRSRHDRIAIASQHSITTSFAPGIVEQLSRRASTQIRLRSANLDECHALLMTRQVDLALTYKIPADAEANESLVEQTLVAEDRLIPVFATSGVEVISRYRSNLPIIAYPADVFFGRVMNHTILPKLENATTVRAVAETALTLAALQLSKQGIGLSWVPARLAADDMRAGSITDLSGIFPSQPLSLIASRLSGTHSSLENDVWALLTKSNGAPA